MSTHNTQTTSSPEALIKRFHEKRREFAIMLVISITVSVSTDKDKRLIPKADRKKIHEYLFREGVLVAKKDFNLPKHNEIDTKNLYVGHGYSNWHRGSTFDMSCRSSKRVNLLLRAAT